MLLRVGGEAAAAPRVVIMSVRAKATSRSRSTKRPASAPSSSAVLTTPAASRSALAAASAAVQVNVSAAASAGQRRAGQRRELSPQLEHAHAQDRPGVVAQVAPVVAAELFRAREGARGPTERRELRPPRAQFLEQRRVAEFAPRVDDDV